MVLPKTNTPIPYGVGLLIPCQLTVPSNPWATFPFLQLPAEIRNKIYDLVFPECRVQIVGNHPQKELVRWRQTHPVLRGDKPRSRLTCKILNKDETQCVPVPLDMLEVCRQINEETTAFLYGRTTFVFDSIKTVNKFLDLAPRRGIINITSIELIQSCYGEPYWTKDTQWKRKADEKWQAVCDRIARELHSLNNLNLNLRLATWPTQLKTTAPWTHPLMILGGSELHRVRITLRHYMFPENRLMMTARNLENLMMTPKGQEQRDLEEAFEAVRKFQLKEAEKAKRPPIRATKCLVIKLAPPRTPKPQDKDKIKSQKSGAANANDKVKVKQVYHRTKGLEGFHRVDLGMVGVAFC